MSSANVFRNERVHVLAARCATCIFRAGNLMELRRGRVAEMIEEATRNDSCIVCHETLSGDNAACRGFYDLHATAALQIAQRLGYIEFVDL